MELVLAYHFEITNMSLFRHVLISNVLYVSLLNTVPTTGSSTELCDNYHAEVNHNLLTAILTSIFFRHLRFWLLYY